MGQNSFFLAGRLGFPSPARRCSRSSICALNLLDPKARWRCVYLRIAAISSSEMPDDTTSRYSESRLEVSMAICR